MNKSANNFTFGSNSSASIMHASLNLGNSHGVNSLRHSVNVPPSHQSSANSPNSSSNNVNTSSTKQSSNGSSQHQSNGTFVKNSNVTLKTRRSGSISSLLPLKENQATSNFSSSFNSNSSNITQGRSNNGITGGMSKLKLNPIPQPKRRKSNSLSIIDYCNIMNMNTNFQMIANFYDDTEASMSRLSMKTTRNANIEKQASLSEQMAALFGSSMCTCCLCKLKILNIPKKSPSLSLPTQLTTGAQNQVALPTSPAQVQQVQQYNFEILPNKHNSDHSIIKYTYSTPFSQLSPLKLFNLMNTDCSIIFNNNETPSQPAHPVNGSQTSSASENAVASVNGNVETSNNGSTSTALPMQFSNNTPPIYDSRYLYLIDCRLNRKQFDKSRIHTAIHYSDLLDDVIYVSPPVDHYTLIVLYDKDGTFLTSTSPVTNDSSFFVNSEASFSSTDAKKPDESIKSSDDLIARIKAKLGCNPLKTFYILSGGYDQFQTSFPYMCSNTDVRSTVDRHKYLTIYPNCVIENQMFIGSGIQAKNWKIIRDLKITHIINCSIEHECVFKDDIKYLHVKLEDTYEENIYKVLEKTILFMQEAFVKYYDELQRYEESTHHHESTASSSRILGSAKSSSSSLTNGHHYNINLSGGQSSKPGANNGAKKPVQPRFLIHCNLGISRSSSILIAYLMAKYKICLYAAFNYVKDKRIQIAPNYSFLRQLKQFEETYGFIQLSK